MISNIRIDFCCNGSIFIFISIVCLLESCNENVGSKQKINSEQPTEVSENKEWQVPDSVTISNNDSDKLILYGMELVRYSAKYFGPKGIINQSANGMNCQNCHLDAGRKLYANSYSAVFANYPKYRARSGTIEHLEKRINDCLERSLNGKKLDSLSKEMRAIVAYINWVGKDVKKGIIPEGASVVDLPWLYRAADKIKGKIAFQKYCVSCHGKNGQGKQSEDKVSFIYPPLWGPHSYNTGAGLYRITRLAGFIRSNMPNLTSTYNKPTLSDEEAWDIAAFISSMPRPNKKYKHDWPDISDKPVDHPFGPYADQYSETRHKYGPYREILLQKDKNRNIYKK